MIRHRAGPGLAVLSLAWLAAGCVQVDYGISLNRDLSGTADMSLAIDLDRLAYATAAVEAAFTGDGGAPTEEDVEAARDELLREFEADEEDFDEAEMRAEIQEDLPEGVDVRHVRQSRDGLKQKVEIGLAFEHVDLLRDVRLGGDSDDPDAEGGALDMDAEDPFGGLEILEEGDELIVRNDPIDPVEGASEDGFLSDATVEKLLQDVRVTFRLETPFEVLEHNATRVDGRTLVWVFDFESLKSEERAGIYARFRR